MTNLLIGTICNVLSQMQWIEGAGKNRSVSVMIVIVHELFQLRSALDIEMLESSYGSPNGLFQLDMYLKFDTTKT